MRVRSCCFPCLICPSLSYCTLGKLVSFEENVSKFEAFLVPQKVRVLCTRACSLMHV
jgi:hypothetical protein